MDMLACSKIRTKGPRKEVAWDLSKELRRGPLASLQSQDRVGLRVLLSKDSVANISSNFWSRCVPSPRIISQFESVGCGRCSRPNTRVSEGVWKLPRGNAAIEKGRS